MLFSSIEFDDIYVREIRTLFLPSEMVLVLFWIFGAGVMVPKIFVVILSDGPSELIPFDEVLMLLVCPTMLYSVEVESKVSIDAV